MNDDSTDKKNDKNDALPRAASSVIARSLPVAVMLPSLEDENNLAQRNTVSVIRVIIYTRCIKPYKVAL